MSFWNRLRAAFSPSTAPRASYQDAGGGKMIVSSADLEEALRTGNVSRSGEAVNAGTAMRVATVYACVRIIAGAVATLPLPIKKRIDDRTREDASDNPLWDVLRRRPNRWQKPAQFRRMMQAHLLLRGNAYALIVRSVRGTVMELIPLHPDRVEVKQEDDLSLTYTLSKKNGTRVRINQADVFHLVGLTLDGVTGLSPIAYARETIGLAMAMENHGASTFSNGARPSGVLAHPGKVGKEGLENLRESIDRYRAGEENDSKILVVEEGITFTPLTMTAEDAQWIESRKFSRSEIAMFFGVPPHMLGDTEKSTSWGSGIEQQAIGFVTYTLEDHLTTWEEAINVDLVPANTPEIYARFNRSALVRGDIKTRFEAYERGRRMKVLSANDVRALEDLNPVPDGDVYENPLIAEAAPPAGGKDDQNVPAQTA